MIELLTVAAIAFVGSVALPSLAAFIYYRWKSRRRLSALHAVMAQCYAPHREPRWLIEYRAKKIAAELLKENR